MNFTRNYNEKINIPLFVQDIIDFAKLDLHENTSIHTLQF